LSVAIFSHGGALSPGADVIISEFLAFSISGIKDEDGENSDWIELTNISGAPVDLAGWSLSDDPIEPNRWVIPSVILAPGEELLVFASGKDRSDPASELHTNFKLSASGEYLALFGPDGTTVESEFSPMFPGQYPDVSYGVGTPGGETLQLVGGDTPLRFHVPGDSSDDVGSLNPWNGIAFNESAWSEAGMGVGFATAQPGDPFDVFIGEGGDVQDVLYQKNSTIYVRVPFEISDPTAVTSLSFAARYDDGFAIYINGSPILASVNAPSDGMWDFEARASANHSDSQAVALQTFTIDLNQVNLVAGSNILAIHGLNRSATSSDFLFDCELSAQVSPEDGPVLVYMNSPTPDAPNAGGMVDLGPVIREVTENPIRPDVSVQAVLKIQAAVNGSELPLGSVYLIHRQGFGSESTLQMRDDGVAPDEVGNDGIYTANLPLAGLQPGEMVRWRIEANDTNGLVSKNPLFFDSLNSPEYYGTAAIDPVLDSDLPVLEWFITSPAAANTRGGTRASVLHLGEFYDNVFCRIRGGSSTRLAKKSYKFDFNAEHHFRVQGEANTVRVEEFNLNTTWTDKAFVRQPLSYQIYDLAGSPGSECFLMRVEQNGAFFSVAAYTEQVDKRLLRRENGIDDDGALYKMFNGGTSGTGGVEKKSREYESNADLSAFISGMRSSGVALENFIFDHVDIPRQLNYLAATVLTQNNDNMTKNYYLYRDTEGSGEWTQLPWDTDLTWGSHYMTNDSIAHDGIWSTADYVLGGRNGNSPISPSHPFVGIQELPGNRSWNRIIDKLLENDRFKDMFRRRLQTLIDEVLLGAEIDDRIDLIERALGNDAVLDKNKWGQFGQQQTLAQAIAILENDYLTPRRNHLSVTHLAANAASYPTPQTSSALLPGPQSANPPIEFGELKGSTVSGNQDEEFIELRNTGSEAVDLSAWSITGGVEFEFLPGTIIEANGSLYVSPDVSGFRSRPMSPTGGEGLNLEGDYAGQISARGEVITLLNQTGGVVDTLTSPDDPSDPQKHLRITELHFAPLGGKGFEFIELQNIGPDNLDLAGIQFTDGVETMLSGSLAPGEYGLVVSNPANFDGLKIVGEFIGALNNGGEQVTLRDSVGENILSFDYEGDWFIATRNGGYSLDLLEVSADWTTWDDQFRWAVSCDVGGSPGVVNPVPHSNDYGSWSRGFFTSAELADPNVSGPSADASGDGTSNLLNYALGLNPILSHVGEFADLVFQNDDVSLRFSRLQKTPDITVTVQVSTDLIDWTTNAALVLTEPNGDGREAVTFTPPIQTSIQNRQFLRIHVVRNP
jgi:hypothetical protein|tara:strand:+ start:117 stop:4004 length:3888 start_codon:yes stop_codon:yes gene_type:complete